MHILVVLGVAWVYFGGGITIIGQWFGQAWHAADFGRRVLLLSYAVILLVRMYVTAFVLLTRRFDWTECIAVIGAVVFYQFGFALLGATSVTPLNAIDLLSVGLFALGSYLNTGSEVQRKKFKENPLNQGKLYTGGMFGVVRHPNYLGDILWASGWAVATHNVWAFVIPILAAAGFVFKFIPELSSYLSRRYGTQYVDWANKTKRLLPYIY